MSSDKDDVEVKEGKGLEKKGRKRKVETAEVEGKTKRKYTKRNNYNKTEVNYTVRKTESGECTFLTAFTSVPAETHLVPYLP